MDVASRTVDIDCYSGSDTVKVAIYFIESVLDHRDMDECTYNIYSNQYIYSYNIDNRLGACLCTSTGATSSSII